MPGGIYAQRFVTCWLYYVDPYRAAQEFGPCHKGDLPFVCFSFRGRCCRTRVLNVNERRRNISYLILKFSAVRIDFIIEQGRTQGGGGCRPAAPLQNRNKKKTDFVDQVITNVLRERSVEIIR